MTEPTRIRSVSKAIRILLYLAHDGDGASAKEIASALDLPVATVYHLVNTLQAEGMLAKDSRRDYHLGPMVGALADSFLRHPNPPEYLLEPLRDLAASTGETAYLSGWQHDEVVVLGTVEGSHAVRVKGLHTGFSGFTHARASGKLFLAFARPGVADRYLATHVLEPRTANTITDVASLRAELVRIRRRGYAIDREEFTVGVSGVSAPVLDETVAVAAYTVAAPTGRFQSDRRALVAAVREAARRARSAAGTRTQDDMLGAGRRQSAR